MENLVFAGVDYADVLRTAEVEVDMASLRADSDIPRWRSLFWICSHFDGDLHIVAEFESERLRR